MTSPTALISDRRSVVEELPSSVEEIDGWAHGDSPSSSPGTDPITLFLTIDTEDAYFTRPHMMTGDGIGREHGVFGILDELDERALRATFFVNVYETDRQPPGAVEEVVREIARRGHEVGLHTHPSPALDFYQRPLFRLNTRQQVDILRWGTDRLERWTGRRTVSFRAGGYALNEETFEAFAEVGLEIDSSWFFPSPHNHLTRSTVNAVTGHGPVVEVPVTTVLRTNSDRLLEQRKLDLDWLSTDQLSAALDALTAHRARFAMFMMHSFSFIEKATLMPDDEPSSRALFRSEPLFSRYVEIYGPKPAMRRAFADFLEWVVASPTLRVRTLGEALPELRSAAGEQGPDVIPIV